MDKTYIQKKLIGVEGQVVSFDSNENAILKNIDSSLNAVLIVTCNAPEITVSDIQGSLFIRNSAQQFIPSDADYYITSDGDTLYTQASNKFIVYLPRIGTWTVSAFVNGINLNKSIFVDGAGTYYVNLSVFNARIEVSYPTGATCTCTCGNVTFTADNKDGYFVFNVPNTGEWTISAYTSTASAVSKVNIQLNGQFVSTELNFIYTSLDSNTWEVISNISKLGEASSYWSIGDVKYIYLNGTMGTISFTNQYIGVFIIGFDHNSAIESDGASTITFAIGKNSQGDKNIAIIDDKYGGSDNTYGNYFTYERSSSYAPSGYYYWFGSKLRLEFLGQDKENPRGLLSCLPKDLFNVLKTARKSSFNNRNDGAQIGVSNDLLFLMSAYEITGTIVWEPNESLVESSQKQYDYFKNNSIVAYSYKNTSSAVAYWTRSVRTSDGGSTIEYYIVSSNSSVNYTASTRDRAVFAAFNV